MTTQLARLEEYQRLLAIVETPEEAGVLRAQMEAIAKQIAPRLSKDRFKWSKAYVEACIKHGEMWNACDNKAGVGNPLFSKNLELDVINISDAYFKSHMDAGMCSKIAGLDRQDVDLYFDECRGNGKYPTLGGVYNVWRFLNPSKPPKPLPTGIYNVIYADPPWTYDNQPEQWGATILHYQNMITPEICALPVRKIAADDAVLFLWVTNPMIPDAFKVMAAWGFGYKTNMVWTKTKLTRPGSGYYIRGRHELLFIATRGSFTPLNKTISPPIGSVVSAAIQEHSRKPECFYETIEMLYPECQYIELFARSKRRGWEAWGDEVGKY